MSHHPKQRTINANPLIHPLDRTGSIQFLESSRTSPTNLGSYIQFKTEGTAILAIWDIEEQNAKVPGSAEVRQNKSSILEFQVDDVDREFQRLTEYSVQWVKEPTTQPWGTRSAYFQEGLGLINT
jgi:uncharacterized glyoxalase superfamily protein PhnB